MQRKYNLSRNTQHWLYLRRGYIRRMSKSTGSQRFMTRQQVISEAREVVRLYGGQVRAAGALSVTQPSISKALKEDDTAMDELRRRILEELGGYRVSAEIHFLVEMPRQQPKRPQR